MIIYLFIYFIYSLNSFVPLSLYNTRLHSYLVSFHFFQSNKFIQFYMQASVFLVHTSLPINSRNVGTRGQSMKGIVLLKYQYFRFRRNTGA